MQLVSFATTSIKTVIWKRFNVMFKQTSSLRELSVFLKGVFKIWVENETRKLENEAIDQLKVNTIFI